jgi:RNA polymerase sigma factor (sigma-70 family)
MPGKHGTVQRQLRTLFHLGSLRDLTDGQILERFATGHGEAAELAFAALVERHGAMVLRICREVLSDPDDADDAFQATFLVLLKKARGLWVRESLGPWLHRVAYRTSCCARSADARRRRHERRAAEIAVTSPSGAEVRLGDEIARALHEEVDRLPERYRVPIVLCDLEGRTCEEAARYTGSPVGTVKSWRARGRERLRERLSRRGITVSEGFVLPAPPTSLSTALSPALTDATLRGVMVLGKATSGLVSASIDSLMNKVLRAMTMEKFRLIAYGCLSVAVLAVGASALPGRDPAGGSSKATGSPAVVIQSSSDPDERALAKADLDLMQGAWTRVSTEIQGKKTLYDDTPPRLIVRKDGFTFGTDQAGKPLDAEKVEIHPKQNPKAIDLTPEGDSSGPLKGKTYPGIYKVEGETLTLCLSIKAGSQRPTKFATKDTFWVLDVYKRSRP